MRMDSRRPVIVGVGQITQRSADPTAGKGVIDLMADSLELAAADTGITAAAAAIQLVGSISSMSQRYQNAARLVADRVGATSATTLQCGVGGNTPLQLLGLLAHEIQNGDLDAAAIVGAEAFATTRALRKADLRREWPTEVTPNEPDRRLGDDTLGASALEASCGLIPPASMYPLLENAVRHHSGRTITEHQRVIAALWSRFSDVGASNPAAWSPGFKDPDFLARQSADNRPTAFPYTKWLNANMGVDQGAALIICSTEWADKMGIAAHRRVYPLAVANANDHWIVSTRPHLHVSPAIRAAASLATQLARTSADDATYIDIYSCFPVAVELAASALGLQLDDPRGLTVTGGLTFAGGPGNNYVTHSLARLVELLRDAPSGTTALATGLGWYATKHSVGYLSNRPSDQPFTHGSAQTAVDHESQPLHVDADYLGPAHVVTNTVVFDRDGEPTSTIALLDTPQGTRTLATSPAKDLAGLAIDDAFIGSAISVRTIDGNRELALS